MNAPRGTERPREARTASTVMMIRPRAFGSNPETAGSNTFQAPVSAGEEGAVAEAARAEFDALAAAVRAAGVEVCVFEDTLDPPVPDAVFPNNWVSFHADGTVVYYPMLSEQRRREVRPDLVAALVSAHGRRVTRTVDLRALAEEGLILEGTGSLVFDRGARRAYAARSPRTDDEAVRLWAERLDYDVLLFDALDAEGTPVYHTNVVMNLGDGLAVVCLEALPDVVERDTVAARLRADGHELLELRLDQLTRFCGNLLELRANDGVAVTVLSRAAHEGLDADQRARLSRRGRVVVSPLDTIERHGGGSARCMLAEVHLPRRGTHDEEHGRADAPR